MNLFHDLLLQTDFTLEFSKFLLKSNALRFGAFTLASGKQSPYYIDLRMLPSFPKLFHLTIHAMKEVVVKEIGINFDTFASIPTSGLIFSSALAYEMAKPFVYVRKESKAYGMIKLLEGHLPSGSRVVIVDDVATTGMSIYHAIEAIRANGGIVENILVLVDRQEGAEEQLKKMDVKMTAVTTVRAIVNTLYDAGLIDDNTLESVMKQMISQGDYENE
jgi:orotate phosphoribosyltransferase